MVEGKRRKVLQIFNIIAFFIMIVFNTLSGTRIFNNKTVGEISDKYPNLFTPAGITFSIWSVIYLFLLIYVFYQARDVFKAEKKEMPFLDQISVFFILSCVFNSIWLIVWLYELILLSLIIMILLLLVLIIIYLRLNIALGDLNTREKIILWTPFSLYLGWITVATIANITVFLVSINWDGFGIAPLIWTVTVIIVALILTLAILYSRKDFIYP
ncbi:MAG: hypothetical protein ACFFDK_18595, partial [Promethearchaeota archaeon]